MKRGDLPFVNQHMGVIARLEAGIRALFHDGGEICLIIRKGSNDLETAVPIDKKPVVAAIMDKLEDEWAQLKSRGVDIEPPTDPSVKRALAMAERFLKGSELFEDKRD